MANITYPIKSCQKIIIRTVIRISPGKYCIPKSIAYLKESLDLDLDLVLDLDLDLDLDTGKPRH